MPHPAAPLRAGLLAAALLVAAPAAARADALPADTFKLKLTGRVQTLYQHTAPDGETNEKLNGESFGTRPAEQSTSLLRIRRGRIGVEGFAYDPRLEYQVQMELAGSSITLKRAFFNYRLRDADVQVRAGKFKVPFGRQQLTSSFQQQAADRSLVSDEFAKGDDDGLMLWGLPAGGRLEYYVGVFNGEGNNRNSQQDASDQWAARLAWSPLGKMSYTGPALDRPARPLFSVGANANLNGGWLYEVNGTTGMQAPTETCTAAGCTRDEGDDSRILSLGVDAALRWRGLSWSGEYFRRTVDPRQDGVAELEGSGWYSQVGMMVIPARLEGGVRYGQLDPSDARKMDRVREVTPFVSYFVRGNDLKVQADYTFLSTEAPDARTGGVDPARLEDGRLRVQLQVAFQ
jgi:hypothetical protein